LGFFFRGGRVSSEGGADGSGSGTPSLYPWAWALIGLIGFVLVGAIVLIALMFYRRSQNAAHLQY